jgi:hypothetical protein
MMNSRRMFYVMIAALGLLTAGVIATAYFANGMIQKQARTLDELKLKSNILQEQQTALIKGKQDVQKYTELEKIANTIVPQDKSQAQTVREIVKMANASGIKPSSITFPASTLGSTVGVKTPGAPAANTNLTQLTPVKGLTGVYIQQITITQDASSPVPYTQFIDFLSRLEQNRRTALVSSIILQPQSPNRDMLAFTLTLDEYIKP